MKKAPHARPGLTWPWLLLLSLLLAACASPTPPPAQSYVTLLASPDGTVGRVLVMGDKGEQLIDQANHAALLDGSTAPAPVDPKRLQRDFAEAMAARPALPQHFVLYCETGSVQLTAASLALLPQILASAAKRASADLSILGHSDTVGSAELNEGLSLRRAQAVAELLKNQGLTVDALSVSAQGKRSLLILTPNDKAEPRNRRVEITVR